MKRRFEKIGAGTALAGGILTAGVLLGHNSTEIVEGKAVPAPAEATSSIEIPPIPATNTLPAPATEAPGATAENPHDSPKNRVRRCVFAAGQAAILEVMRAPETTVKQTDKTFYTYGPEQSFVGVDTSTPGKAVLDYEIHAGSQDEIGYSARGLITIPLTGSVEESLAAVDPEDLHTAYEIDDGRSAVYELGSSGATGTNAKETFTQDQADIECGIADDFIEKVQQEYGS